MKYEAIKVGDILPHEPPQALLVPGRQRWFGLLSLPSAEAKARTWIEHHITGAQAFYPVTTARRPRRQGGAASVEYERRYLPGYVFARVPGDPVWHRLFTRCPHVHDVVRFRSGHPAVIDPASLKRIYAMRSVDTEIKAREKLARTIRQGDRVSFEIGGVDHEGVEVTRIEGPFGVVNLRLLGRDAIKVPLAGMRKA